MARQRSSRQLRLMLVHEARGPKGLIGEKAGNVDAVDLVRSRDRRVRSGQPVSAGSRALAVQTSCHPSMAANRETIDPAQESNLCTRFRNRPARAEKCPHSSARVRILGGADDSLRREPHPCGRRGVHDRGSAGTRRSRCLRLPLTAANEPLATLRSCAINGAVALSIGRSLA